MAETLHVGLDVLLHQHVGRWLASNPHLRTHVELDAAAIGLLTGHQRLERDEWAEILGCARARDATAPYFGTKGLHADHSGISDKCGPWLAGNELLGLLRERGILIANRQEVMSRIAPLEHLLDHKHVGTFHQRIGQYLLLERRTRETWRAWQDQKFTSDGTRLLPGNYQHVQERFFDRHFSAAGLKGARVIDFGCGNGHYSGRFARLGASVVALDSSEELISLARTNHGSDGHISFIVTRDFPDTLSVLGGIEARSIDLIYLQDTLLLLLAPERGAPDPLLPQLLLTFHRLLKPSGTLCAMEPNPSFWLAERYGDPQAPYALVTEYRNPVFHVAPTLDRVMQVMSAAGFALTGYLHPAPTDATHPDFSYILEFPIWDFLSFTPMP